MIKLRQSPVFRTTSIFVELSRLIESLRILNVYATQRRAFRARYLEAVNDPGAIAGLDRWTSYGGSILYRAGKHSLGYSSKNTA